MRTTTYRGAEVDTTPALADEEGDLLCLNDDCPGLEEQRDEDTGEVVEVLRVAWDGRYVGPSGPTYASGGDPGYYRRDACPSCGRDDCEAL